MPPKRKASDPLSGTTICLSGTLSKGRKDIEADIKAAGGKVAGSITKTCTHLVTTTAEFLGPTAKVSSAVAAGIPVVGEGWLTASVSAGSLADTAPYALGAAAPVAAAAAPAKKGKTAAPPAVKAKAKPKAAPKVAAAVAAAPVAAASGGGGRIPVEKGLVESGKLSGSIEVHEDYAWLGNQVNIGDNNNKFYRGQVVKAGSAFYAWTRWGRVGEGGQNSLDGPTSEAAAVASFQAKFKSKSSYAWAGANADYPGGKKGKYTVIHEAHDSSQSAKLKAAAGEEPPAKVVYAKAETTGALASFVELVTNKAMFDSALATMGVDTSKMPLGDISQRTVDDGFKALLAVEAYLKTGGGPRLAELCSAFYTYIPHAFGRKAAPLLTMDDVQAKKTMLNIIGDVGTAMASQKSSKAKKRGKGKKAAAAGVVLEPAPIDVAYESLGSRMALVPKDSPAFKMIEAFTKNTQGYRKCEVVDAFEVARDGDAFETAAKGIGNRRLLWHGTNVAVVAAILKSGLRIMPHSGGRVGSGIYLASENGKSAGYVTAQGHTGVMFLCEAALGKQRFITTSEIGYNDKDPVSALGLDSVLAIGTTEPDPKQDVEHSFDGGKTKVKVAQGTVKPNPLLKAHGGHSQYSQSEYLVYKESQCTIRYVLKMKFDTPGGHWH